MISLKLVLDKQKINQEGECPIMIKLVHNKMRRFINLFQKVKMEDWDSKRFRLNERLGTLEQRQNKIRVNFYIESEVMKLKKIIMDFELTRAIYTIDDIVKGYYKKSSIVPMYDYINDIILSLERIGKNGNSNVYRETLERLKKFSNKENLTFGEVDYGFLKNFESYLLGRGCKINTVSFYLRTIRSVFNKAIKDGLIEEEYYPFKKITIRKEKTLKRAIYKDDIAALKNLDLMSRPVLDLARDIFLFSFYMRGMSFKDIAFLKVANIVGDRIYYSRQKTAQKLNIKLTDKAMEIILKYNNLSNKGAFIFPIIRFPGRNEFSQYKNGYRKTNQRLKVLGKLLGMSVPLTTYVARHSWASIAKRSGIPTSVISEGLGHDSEKTTQIYLDSFENNVLDDANDLITDI
ncbi:site-specific integrase [Odoribacter lunatus]|uniref:site-specific integrase n=1 Tax=Odoribacter lunatus TaxID=2941335 RepID=UPI00203B81E3|nr:site-specific integrase [Odoribacter lunatus]